jgi:hypothetical protein
LNVAPPLLRSARTCPSHRLPFGGGACECERARGGVGAAQIPVAAVRYHDVGREIAHVLPEDENRHPVEPAAEGYQAHKHGLVKVTYCTVTPPDNHSGILRVSALSRAAPLAGKTVVVSIITGVTPEQDAGVRSGD